MGAIKAANPKELAMASDIVITMLPDSPEVEQVLLGSNGVFEGAKAGTLIIDMSTISPSAAIRLAHIAEQKGLKMLDAPVTGADVGAKEGTLTIMVGGKRDDFERAMPIFQVLGKTIVHVGDHGAGQTVKACNQIVTALTLEAISEALLLAKNSGIDPSTLFTVLSSGLASSRILDVKKDKFLSGRFDPGFKISLHEKDLNIALSTARQSGVPLPLTSLVQQMFVSLKAQGLGNMDHSAVFLFLESLVERKT
jgi:2-hydroxy-3-oxopropionate reductase